MERKKNNQINSSSTSQILLFLQSVSIPINSESKSSLIYYILYSLYGAVGAVRVRGEGIIELFPQIQKTAPNPE